MFKKKETFYKISEILYWRTLYYINESVKFGYTHQIYFYYYCKLLNYTRYLLSAFSFNVM